MHPKVAFDLKSGLTNTFAGLSTDLSNEALRSGFIGQIAGIKIFETGNMANTGTGGDFKGGMFHKDALGLAMMQDIKIETQRDASIRGTEIVASMTVGSAIVKNNFGVKITVDSAL